MVLLILDGFFCRGLLYFCHGVSFSSERHHKHFRNISFVFSTPEEWLFQDRTGPAAHESPSSIPVWPRYSSSSHKDDCRRFKHCICLKQNCRCNSRSKTETQKRHHISLREYHRVYLNQSFTDALRHSSKTDRVDNTRWNCLWEERKKRLNLKHVAKQPALSDLCFIVLSLIREIFLGQQVTCSGQRAII